MIHNLFEWIRVHWAIALCSILLGEPIRWVVNKLLDKAYAAYGSAAKLAAELVATFQPYLLGGLGVLALVLIAANASRL
jgi:hypothetical protein